MIFRRFSFWAQKPFVKRAPDLYNTCRTVKWNTTVRALLTITCTNATIAMLVYFPSAHIYAGNFVGLCDGRNREIIIFICTSFQKHIHLYAAAECPRIICREFFVVFMAGLTLKNSERDPAGLTELMYNTKSPLIRHTQREICALLAKWKHHSIVHKRPATSAALIHRHKSCFDANGGG